MPRGKSQALGPEEYGHSVVSLPSAKKSAPLPMEKGLMRMRSHRGRVPHRDRRIMSSGRVAVLFAVVLTVSTQLSHAATVEWYRTAQGTTDRITAQPSVSFGDDFASNIAVTINRLAYSYWAHFNMLFRSMTYQTVLGFGGAFTDSASFVFSKLNSTLQTQVLDMYFSESGLRYNMARLPIGSCDFSLENYNYDNVSGDVNLTHFSIDHDRERIIPLIKRALAVRQQWTNDSLNILGSPWSPPRVDEGQQQPLLSPGMLQLLPQRCLQGLVGTLFLKVCHGVRS